MPSLWSIVVAFFLIGLPLSAQGEDPPTGKAPDPRLEELVRKLASDDFAERRSASEALRTGDAALREGLKALLPQLPLEARLRAAAILRRPAEKKAARLEDSGTRLSFDLKERPLSEVLAVLGSGSGATLRLNTRGLPPTQARERRCSLKVEELPFWETLDRFCAQEGFIVYRDYRSGDLLLNPGTPPKAPVLYRGPMRVSLDGITITRSTRFNAPAQVHMNLQIRVDVEDGAPLNGFLAPIGSAIAKDDTGSELKSPENRYPPTLRDLGARRQFTANIRLDPPKREATKLEFLEFRLNAVVPRELSIRKLDDLTPREKQEQTETPAATPPISVEWVKETPKELQLQVSYESITPEGATASNIRVPPSAQIHLEDAEGNALPYRLNRRQTKGDREYQTLVLELGKSVERLRLESLVTYEVRELSFRLENVPLP